MTLILRLVFLWAALGASTDAELEMRIRERLSRAQAGMDGMDVRVSRGVVTLSGRAGTIQRKAAATRIARQAGARKVVNQIQVSAAARSRSNQSLSRSRRSKR